MLRSTDPDQKQNVQIRDRYGLPVRNIDGKNVATAAQTTDFTYGPFNQLREIRDNLRNSVIINYYTYGQVADQYDSKLGGRVYTYTPLDELKTATAALDRTRAEARGDQTTTTYGYQPKTDRIASISALRGTELVQSLTYQYNGNGTVRERHDHLAASFPEVFGYDELNRLKERRQQQSAGADLVDTFDYDALGNLTQMPGLGTYTFEQTRPQLVASAGGHQYHHDANGNLDSRSGPSMPGGSQTLAYNAFDMPKRITPGAASAVPDVELD